MAIDAAKLLVKIGADITEAEAGVMEASGLMKQWGNTLTRSGLMLTAGITAPLTLAGKSAVDMATEYDRAMNVLQVTSGASGKEMDLLRAKAKELGSDLTLPGTSAADAGQAMLELSKAGMEVNDIMAASRGVLQMSAAGQLSNAAAAEITANALNAFGLAGSEAVRVADLLAAGANASSAEVLDMADSLKMSAAVFAATGVPIEDLTTSIALMANAGIQGSDAGTSLKQMLLSLQAPSGKAADLMEDLGISVYDAQGAMIPMEDIIGVFSEQLGGLSDEQRNAALATIFGSDAVRAANVVLMGGVDAFETMEEAVTKQGAAADLAGAQMEGLKGGFEKLTDAVDTAKLNAVEPFQEDLVTLVEGLANTVNAFNDMDEGTRKLIVSAVGLTAAVGPASLALGTMLKMTAGLGPTLVRLPTLIGEVGAGISLLKGGAGVFEVMSLGGGATAASMGALALKLGAVGLAVGAVTAAWVQWNEQVVKTNEEGVEEAGSAWEAFFNDQIEAGKDATVMLDAYLAAQARVDEQLRKSNPIARLFVDTQGLEVEGLKELGKGLSKVGADYDDYIAALKAAAAAAGYHIDENGNLVESLEYYGAEIERVVEAGYALSEMEYGLADMTRYSADMAHAAALAMQSQGEAMAGATPLIDETATATEGLIEADQQLMNDLALVREAYDLNVISYQAYINNLGMAEFGTLALSEAQRGSLEAAVADAEIKREIAEAAAEMAGKIGEAKVAQLDLAESFRGATAADAAKQMIDGLKDTIAATGDPTGMLTDAVRDMQTEFGLVTPASLAMAENFGTLQSAIESGIVPTDLAGEALRLFRQDAADGSIDLENLFTTLGIAPEQFQPFLDTMAAANESTAGVLGGVQQMPEDLATMGEAMVLASGEPLTKFNTGLHLTKINYLDPVALKIQEIYKVHLKQLIEKIENLYKVQFVNLGEAMRGIKEEKIPGLVKSFGDLRSAVIQVTEKVKELKEALDSLPSSKTIRINMVKSEGGGNPRAEGGPVYAGQSYIVGERGPELFVPAQSGRILSHADSMAAMRDGGEGRGNGSVYNVNVTTLGDADSVANEVMRRLGQMEALYA